MWVIFGALSVYNMSLISALHTQLEGREGIKRSERKAASEKYSPFFRIFYRLGWEKGARPGGSADPKLMASCYHDLAEQRLQIVD